MICQRLPARRLKVYNVTPSMSHKDCCCDNVAMEAFSPRSKSNVSRIESRKIAPKPVLCSSIISKPSTALSASTRHSVTFLHSSYDGAMNDWQYRAGLRISEALALTLADVDLSAHQAPMQLSERYSIPANRKPLFSFPAREVG